MIDIPEDVKRMKVVDSAFERANRMQLVFEGDVMPAIDWQAVVRATIDKAVLEERSRCAAIAQAVIDEPNIYNWAWDAAVDIKEKIENDT